MDTFLLHQVASEHATHKLAEDIAKQRMLVETLGAENAAVKTPEEALAQSTRYEMECARLQSMRQRLAERITEKAAFGHNL